MKTNLVRTALALAALAAMVTTATAGGAWQGGTQTSVPSPLEPQARQRGVAPRTAQDTFAPKSATLPQEPDKRFDYVAHNIERTAEFQDALKRQDSHRIESLLREAGAGDIKIRAISVSGKKVTITYAATWKEIAIVIFILF